MSTFGSVNHRKKIYGIVGLQTDLIFLSDIRLCNADGISNSNELRNSFRCNPIEQYKFYGHSRSNKRGVGILIKHNSPISVIDQRTDEEDNLLVLKVGIGGKEFLCGSIYGPNRLNANFFADIRRILIEWRDIPFIFGGDWNCVYSCSLGADNIDIFNMRSPPQITHSKLLKKICMDFSCSDPFRIKYPNRREFTYFPKDAVKNNRSRLDFFIASNEILSNISECKIHPNMQNSMFDHRAVSVSFKDPPKVIRQPTISRFLNTVEESAIIVKLAIAETYFIHTDFQHTVPMEDMLEELGRMRNDMRNAGPDSTLLPPGTRSEEEENSRSATVAGVKEFLDRVPFRDLEWAGFKNDLSEDIFMETLLMSIRNECISQQHFLDKKIREGELTMKKRLASLKDNYDLNQGEIREIESKLDQIIDRKLRSKLEAHENFELINNERITPQFLNLAKGSKSEYLLTDIKDSRGEYFKSNAELQEFIRDYYMKLYSLPESDLEFDTNCIYEFLGDEICNSPIVNASKVPLFIKDELELEISLIELDESVKQGNKSAAGRDGLNNGFIKKHWEFLRVPLYRYTKCCIRKGTLTQTFSTASIRLIPKKGDATQLKNWRPISLLSCLYKVISRAANNRLKRVNGYIFSRAQKGFTQHRYIQEVLINVIEMIAHCKKYNIPGAILSIDQAKAFDSVSHKYMHEVYKFFGFGNNFIRTLEVLGNNRSASIIFDDGSYSRPFNLRCGRAQGNTTSPIEYNMAQQILLFKIELCPLVKSVYINHLIARPYLANPVDVEPYPLLEQDLRDLRFRHECTFETSKADGFADDNTTGTLMEYESLSTLKTILDGFASYSGLKCNLDKTTLMPVGLLGPIPQNIIDLGFKIESSIHILGMDIDQGIENLDENFDSVIGRVRRGADFWKQFHLTLPGRINIIKSILFCQILYLGNFIMPSAEKIKSLQKILDDFAVGTMNFAKKKIYMQKNQGGLGLFAVENFLITQQANWVCRAFKSTRDNWRVKLRGICNGNVLCAGPHLICKDTNPILHGIASSYQRVRLSHDSLNSNFCESFVLNNPLLFRGPGNKLPLDLTYLGLAEGSYNVISGLKLANFFTVHGVKSRLELLVEYGLDIPIQGYAKLIQCTNHFVARMRPNHRNNGSADSFCNTFLILKKPCKKMRKLMTKKALKNFNLETLTTTQKFFSLIDVQYRDNDHFSLRLSLWNCNGFYNRQKTFAFKFFNNLLGLNVRLSHFVENQSRNCTFCTLSNRQNTDETFAHLFFECETTRNWQTNFISKFLGIEQALTISEQKQLFFLGEIPGGRTDNYFFISLVVLFQALIWENKLKKKIPSFNTMQLSYLELVNTLLLASKISRESAEKLNFPICRHFGYGVRIGVWGEGGGPPGQRDLPP